MGSVPQDIQYPRNDNSGWKWHIIGAGIIGMAATIPLLILFARIIETSLETIRTIYIARGHANLAACIGITKTGIWLLSTGLVLTNLSDYWNLFAYLAGYGLGTLLGMEIEKKISLGHVIVRLITPDDPRLLIANLSGLGYGMTRIEGSGSFSNTVAIILMIVPRPELGPLMDILSKEYPAILYTVEDVRNIKEGAKIFHRNAKTRLLGVLWALKNVVFMVVQTQTLCSGIPHHCSYFLCPYITRKNRKVPFFRSSMHGLTRLRMPSLLSGPMKNGEHCSHRNSSM
jgi:uncharacterized protein YebE (UPF0316 family)